MQAGVQVGRAEVALNEGGWYHDIGADVLYVQVRRGTLGPGRIWQAAAGASTVVYYDEAGAYGVEVVGAAGWSPPDSLPPDVAARVAPIVARLRR